MLGLTCLRCCEIPFNGYVRIFGVQFQTCGLPSHRTVCRRLSVIDREQSTQMQVLLSFSEL